MNFTRAIRYFNKDLYKNNTHKFGKIGFILKQTKKKLWLFDGTKHIKLRNVRVHVCECESECMCVEYIERKCTTKIIIVIKK